MLYKYADVDAAVTDCAVHMLLRNFVETHCMQQKALKRSSCSFPVIAPRHDILLGWFRKAIYVAAFAYVTVKNTGASFAIPVRFRTSC